MRLNQIKLYDLNAVNTTITLRELVLNPDTQKIYLYDLEAITTNIKLRYFGETSGSIAWTLNLADSVILSEAISKVFGKNISDSVTLSDSLSGGIPGGQTILAYRWYFVKIFVARLEGRIVFRIRIFD